MKQPISMIRGTTQTISIKVNGADGSPYTFLEGDVLRFGVKKNPKDSEYLIMKELTSANLDEDDSFILILEPSDTIGLDFGSYAYDVGLQTGQSYFNVIECSDFEVTYNITEVEDNA